MSKIIVFNMITVDGYFAGPNGEIDWHRVDEEFNEFAIDQLKRDGGMLLFGRVTYDLMASYWPSEKAIKGDPIVADLMNKSQKIVFSKSLKQADWNNTRVMEEIEKSELEKLKRESEKNLLVLGSGQITQKLTELGLVDEYRLIVNPVILGAGKPLFKQRGNLKLNSSRQFKNGNVLLDYNNE